MCLSAILPLRRPKEINTNVGYKVFSFYKDPPYTPKRLRGVFHTNVSILDGSFYKEDVWYESKNGTERIDITTRSSYPAGFHIFISYRAAEKYRKSVCGFKDTIIRKVEFASPVAVGVTLLESDAYAETVVARSMKILKEKKRRK